MGRLRIAALAVAALILAAGAPAAATAAPSAAPKAVTKYFALDGSGSHLFYAAKKTAKSFDGTGGTQYVVDGKKHRTAVPAGYRAFLVGDEPLFRKQVVVQDGVTDVLWIRPERGTSGRWSVPEASSIVSEAPNGWVIRTEIEGGTDGRQAYELRRVTTDGTMADLGVPRPDGEPFTAQATPTGLLIADPSDGGDTASAGTLQFMPWSKPGSYSRIYPARGAAATIGTPISCGDSSSTQVHCIVGMDEDAATRLIPLDGAESKVFAEKCALRPAVRTAAVAWTDRTSANGCKAGRIEQRTAAGKLTTSTRRYYRLQDPVTAFGKLVVATSTQRHLVTISNPTSTPVQIVGG